MGDVVRFGPLSEPVGQHKYLAESGECLRILEDLWILPAQSLWYSLTCCLNVSSKTNRSCLYPVSSPSHAARSASLRTRSLTRLCSSVCVSVRVRAGCRCLSTGAGWEIRTSFSRGWRAGCRCLCTGAGLEIGVSFSRRRPMLARARTFIQQTLNTLHIKHGRGRRMSKHKKEEF